MEKYTEIADMVFVEGSFLTTARFYRGRVQADAFEPFNVAFEELVALNERVPGRFIQLVQRANPSLKSLPLSYTEGNLASSRWPTFLSCQVKEIPSGLQMAIEMGKDDPQGGKRLETTYSWNAESDVVTIVREGEYDITWGEWLLWVGWVADFCKTVKLYKGA